jgi:quercetin dioxygenase-like cupin family protein
MIDSSLYREGMDYSCLPNHEDIPNPTPLVFGTHYLFRKKGVLLRPHNHLDKPETEHFTIVLSGQFFVDRDGLTSLVNAGDILDFESSQQHSFVSLEPGAILNVLKAGSMLSSIEQRIVNIRAEAAEAALQLQKIT